MKKSKSFYNWLHRTWLVMLTKALILLVFIVIVYSITMLVLLWSWFFNKERYYQIRRELDKNF
jgi:hypothetical protein